MKIETKSLIRICLLIVLLTTLSTKQTFAQTNYKDEFIHVVVIDSAAVPNVAENIRNDFRATLLPLDGYDKIMRVWNDSDIPNSVSLSSELASFHKTWLKEWKKKLRQLGWKNKDEVHNALEQYAAQHPFVLLPDDKAARDFYRAAINYSTSGHSQNIAESYNHESFIHHIPLIPVIEAKKEAFNQNNVLSVLKAIRKISQSHELHQDELNQMLTEEYPLNDLTIPSIVDFYLAVKNHNNASSSIIEKEDFELLKHLEYRAKHDVSFDKYRNIMPKKTITKRNPDYDPWLWIKEAEFEWRNDTYPIEESYGICKQYPEYRLRKPEKTEDNAYALEGYDYALIFKDEVLFFVRNYYYDIDKVKLTVSKHILKGAYEADKYNISRESDLIQKILKDYIYADGKLLKDIEDKYQRKYVNDIMKGATGKISQEEFIRRQMKHANDYSKDPSVAAADIAKKYIAQIANDTPSLEVGKSYRIDGCNFIVPIFVGEKLYNVLATVTATIDKDRKCHDKIVYKISTE